jgi:hypothetical protein
MGIWCRVEQLLWREAEETSPVPPAPNSVEATGVPVILRKAMRFLLIGYVATMLTAQAAGIRLVASVDASGSYRECALGCQQKAVQCRAACSSGPSGDACRLTCDRKELACYESCQREDDRDDDDDEDDDDDNDNDEDDDD